MESAFDCVVLDQVVDSGGCYLRADKHNEFDKLVARYWKRVGPGEPNKFRDDAREFFAEKHEGVAPAPFSATAHPIAVWHPSPHEHHSRYGMEHTSSQIEEYIGPSVPIT